MILIIGIIGAVMAAMIYIYAGLRMGESITDQTIYIFYWIVYLIFGLIIFNILMLGQFWGVLSKKTGPPGPRGPLGDSGEPGMPGECTMDHNMVFTMKRIKEAIQQVVDDNIKEAGDDTGSRQVYNANTGKLVNAFLENRIQMMISSKQYEMILTIPTSGKDSEKQIGYQSFGKSLEDLTGYLVGIWVEWITAILTANREQALEFLTTLDAQPDIAPEIESYFQNEVEKYDIWYWGVTRVFRPLKAEVCRRTTIPGPDGRPVPNTNLPVGNRPRLQFREVEYSDYDTSQLIRTWTDKGLPDAVRNPRDWSKSKRGVYGKLANPIAMIPKPIKDGPQTFYPIGQVFIEGKANRKSKQKKKTIVVSGDVIIPDVYTQTWSDRKDQNLLRKGGWGFTDGEDKGQFYRLGTTNPGYVCIGDYFVSNHKTPDEIRAMFGYDKSPNKKYDTALSKYTGIVCVPKDCVEEVPADDEPTWAYQFWSLFYRYGKNMVDLFTSKKPADSYNIVRSGNSGFKGKRNPALKGTKHYRIKASCLRPSYENNPAKELDDQFGELGFGWFGYPFKQYRKYSIFSYLGLMPEGIITHRASGRKFYIRHYGGIEPNRYVVVNWNPNKEDYTESIKAVASDKCVLAELSLSDDRQQWMIDKKNTLQTMFRLVSVAYPNKYLKLDFTVNPEWDTAANPENPQDISLRGKRPPGVSVDHTRVTPTLTSAKGLDIPGNKTLFFNTPAYGVGENIIKDKEARAIDRTASDVDQIKQQKELDTQTNFGFVFKSDPVTNPDTLVYPEDKVSYTEEDRYFFEEYKRTGKVPSRRHVDPKTRPTAPIPTAKNA